MYWFQFVNTTFLSINIKAAARCCKNELLLYVQNDAQKCRIEIYNYTMSSVCALESFDSKLYICHLYPYLISLDVTSINYCLSHLGFWILSMRKKDIGNLWTSAWLTAFKLLWVVMPTNARPIDWQIILNSIYKNPSDKEANNHKS